MIEPTLSTVLTPLSHRNLKLASQIGVKGVTLRYPKNGLHILRQRKKKIDSYGLKVIAVEGFLPIEDIKLNGAKAKNEFKKMETLILEMEKLGIPTLCYNFMAGSDWSRSDFMYPDRGGAFVSTFNIDASKSKKHRSNIINEKTLWKNLYHFIDFILPLAEKHKITLALHPDDPPVKELNGYAKIFNKVKNFDRFFKDYPSKYNGLCYCQGTFKEMGVNVVDTIKHFNKKIKYVHFRDVSGNKNNFKETFIDKGPTDMYQAMKAYFEIGFSGPMRPDHVPQLYGEDKGDPGYTMLGRLHAFGYIQGLIGSVKSKIKTN